MTGSAAPKRDSPGRVAVGYVARAKGVRGEVGIQLLSWDPERFHGLRRVRLERTGEPDRELKIQHCRSDARGPLIKFTGIDTPEAARQQLVGGYLTVAGEDVAPLPEGAFYVFDVIGCEVWDQDLDVRRGVVLEVLAMPSTDVYAVRPDGGGEVLIPAVKNFVVSIDTEAQRITVQGVAELFKEGKGS
jgi:16S rRNA processing protein RimM